MFLSGKDRRRGYWLGFLLLMGSCHSKDALPELTPYTAVFVRVNDHSKSDDRIIRSADDFCTIRTDYNSFTHTSDKRFKWVVNGEKIHVSSLSEFKINAHEGLDTMYFIHPDKKGREMILCDLRKGERYVITYNTCCSDFYFRTEGKNDNDRLVEFYLTAPAKNIRLIGGVGFEAAVLKPQKQITLKGDYMRSPLFPNRYRIFVEPFRPAHKDSTIARVIDAVTKKELVPFKDADKKLVDFQYIFLNNDRLRLTVDPLKNSVKVDRIK
jgi:hypothetical protein